MRVLRWTWPVFAIALLVLIPRGCHALRSEVELNVVVVSKTVPFENRIEHRSLFWLLDHRKIVKPDGTRYDRDEDYLGAFPGPEPGDPPERTTGLGQAEAARADLVYITDTYGVYEGDLESGAEMKTALDRTPKIYGGLETYEAETAALVVRNGKILVAEFNTMASPTPTTARRVMEQTLGVRWTRWIGRYFARLEETEEVPPWMRENYEREWNRKWEFQGPGYVMLRDDSHVEVLRPGEELERNGMVLDREMPVDPLLLDSRDVVLYPNWFSLVETDPGTRVIASFSWRPTGKGAERLRARGLPLRFPAVCRRVYPGGGQAYYFSGDFSDNPMPDARVPLAGYPTFKRWFEGARIAPSDASFYWRFYVPMMTRMLDEAAEQRG